MKENLCFQQVSMSAFYSPTLSSIQSASSSGTPSQAPTPTPTPQPTSMAMDAPLPNPAPNPVASSGPVVITSAKKCNYAICTRRLLLSDLACRCGHRFCSAHRYSTEHMCSFDYRKMATANLSSSLVKCVASSLKEVV